MSALRTVVTNFLSRQFPDIDFLPDKLHWLSVCFFGIGETGVGELGIISPT